MAGVRKIYFVAVPLIIALAVFDAYEEQSEFTGILFTGFLAMIAPLMAIFRKGYRQKNYQPSLWRDVETGFVLVIGLLGYGYFAFNGPSDPDTAAHIQVFVFAIAYVGFTSVFLACSGK